MNKLSNPRCGIACVGGAIGLSAALLVLPAFCDETAFQFEESVQPAAWESADDPAVDLQLYTLRTYYFETTPHEYGPPGYVRKQHGIEPPMQAYESNRSPRRSTHSVVAHGPGGKKTLIRWGGAVNFDSTFDFDPIGSNGEFVTATIPVPQQRGQNSDFTARGSRLNLKTQSDSDVGPITTYAQLDFFGDNMQEAFASYRPRLRFFYFDVGWFRFGQDASVFMDYSVYPNVIENEGPAGMVLMRQPVIRVTAPLSACWKVALAAEQPYSDITVPLDMDDEPIGNRIQDVPDLTAHLRYDDYLGHLQLSGLLRQLTYQPPTASNEHAVGYGVNFTGDLHPCALLFGGSPQPDSHPAPLDKDRILWQYAAGYGISRYIQDANGLGVDAGLDLAGDLDALFARAWFLGYEHWWTDRWVSTFVYSENANSGTATMPTDTYAGAQYVAANLVWNFTESAWTGLEFLWGERRDLDGQSATAKRIEFGVYYGF